MSEPLLIVFGLAGFFLLLLGGLWIPFAIAAAGLVTMIAIDGLPALRAVGFVSWSSMNSSTLSAIPLFILMAELLLRSDMSRRFYAGLAVLVQRLPGGLLQTNIMGCALFAAISGSSVATAAAIGTVAIPQLKEKGYDVSMTTGSIAAGGTLGILIPPSIAMILYGTFAEVSVAKLFLAGFIPGALLTLMFMAYISIRCMLQPELAPRLVAQIAGTARLRAILDLLPVVLLMLIVLASIYSGVATPTEAAAVGVMGALIVSGLAGRLTSGVVLGAFSETLKVSSAILFIALAAFIFAYGMEKAEVGTMLASWISAMQLTPTIFLLLLLVMYLLLGCVVDSIGMIVLTIPVLVPVLTAMDIDLVWFGIMLVAVIEMGQITPPLGINLFVVDSIARQGIITVIRGTAPYYGVIILFILLLWLFPALTLWLPATMS